MSGRASQLIDITRWLDTDLLNKQVGDLLLVLVNSRGDDVGWGLACELDDPLSEIGLDRENTCFLQGMIEMYLLGGHAL